MEDVRRREVVILCAKVLMELRALLMELRALLMELRALLMELRALWAVVWTALLIEERAVARRAQRRHVSVGGLQRRHIFGFLL
jgi:hypothetical protein